jgi:hypothetical protein
LWLCFSWRDGDDSQLAWKIEAVERCRAFPLGVRTNYRAYSTDSAFEILQDPQPSNGLGYKAVKTHCKWEPRASPANHNIAGTYILQSLPREPLYPAEFVPGSRSAAEKTVREFAALFPAEKRAISWWECFLDAAAESDDVWEYFEHPGRRFSSPLEDVLFKNLSVTRPASGVGQSASAPTQQGSSQVQPSDRAELDDALDGAGCLAQEQKRRRTTE